MSNTNRNDVKQLAKQIETLAQEVQTKLDSNGDFLSVANELVRNNVTFVFALGEVYALEQAGTTKKVTATTVSNPSGTPRNYHNKRDSRGRFAPKV
jgi:hypothetical protein